MWASKGFLFIRINPSFHLDEESLRLMNADFGLFRMRLELPDNSFKREYRPHLPPVPPFGSAA